MDELSCTTKTHFYCTNGLPRFVAASKVTDGVPDCEDYSDECPNIKYNPLASIKEMIENSILRYSMWIIFLVAAIGNISVICGITKGMRDKNQNVVAKCNNVIICNLAFADLIMAIALMILLYKSLEHSGEWCLYDQIWRLSQLCSGVGVLVTISSEASVMTLVIMTSFRLKTVLCPFKSRHQKILHIIIGLTTTWIVSISMALFPFVGVLSHIMAPDALISFEENNTSDISIYFPSKIIPFHNFSRFVAGISALGNNSINISDEVGNKWNNNLQFLQKNYHGYAPNIDAVFGYYSANSVCMPRIYKTSKDQIINPFAVTVMSFNLIAMCYISLAYMVVYLKSKAPVSIGRNQSRNIKLQKKIAILVLTDVLCWFPICVISFISIANAPVSAEIYAYTLIIQLPINSALNPIIYSNLVQQTHQYLTKLVKSAYRVDPA